MTLEVAVVMDGDTLLHKLRTSCRDFSFSDAVGPRTAIIITDRAAAATSSAVTLFLTDDESSAAGETIRIGRSHFDADPVPFMKMAFEIARMRVDAESARDVAGLMREADLDAACERVVTTACERGGFSHATLLIHDPEVERYVPAYSNEPNYAPSGEYLPGVPPDALQAAIQHREHYAVQPARGGAFVAVLPLLLDEDLVGVLQLTGAQQPDIAAVSNAAAYLRAVAPVIVRLHQLSKSKDLVLRDDLTKAYNRRFFDTHLDEEVERARRYGAVLSIIFLDLDDLKLVNNKYGHMAGSRLLQEVARRILGAVRNIDKVVRFGGDEFCVILPETDPEQATHVATRVRAALSQRPFSLEAGVDIAMTASFGIATYPLHARTRDELIRRADAAMYTVKSSTKNAIHVAASNDDRDTRAAAEASQA